jgi:hypothetical protein
MIDCNSNCYRVDAAKALANQLRTQAVTKQKTEDGDAKSGRLQGELQNLDTQIKSGDAKKAEDAVSAVKREISASAAVPEPGSSDQLPGRGEPFRGFVAYA